MDDQTQPRISWLYLLLLLPCVGLLWVSLYNFREPALFGLPFFYWYQFAWIPLTILITWFIYRVVHD